MNSFASRMPLILIVPLSDDHVGDSALTARAAGWRVETSNADIAMLRIRDSEPDLLLFTSPRMSGFVEPVAQMRTASRYGMVLPILCYLTDSFDSRDTPRCLCGDGIVEDSATLRVALGRWWPLTSAHPAARLARTFDAALVADLLDRFQETLTLTVTRIDSSKIDQVAAHQISGLAGTLGLPELCTAWRGVELGLSSSIEQAHIVSRKTIMMLTKSSF